MNKTANNKIEATGNKLDKFSKAGCPCASFRTLKNNDNIRTK